MEIEYFERRVRELKPWRYNHEKDGLVITGIPSRAPLLDEFRGREILQHVIQGVMADHEISEMSAIDLGCLEGHNTDVLCAQGFKRVVGADLSDGHIERAKFLLQEFKEWPNAEVAHVDILDGDAMRKLGKFNVVLFMGIFYHLRDPIQFFDILEALRPDEGPFYVIFHTQFKAEFDVMVDPRPRATMQVKDPANRGGGKYMVNSQDGSKFDRLATRYNPAALKQIIEYFGYADPISYDTPLGTDYMFHLHLILSKNPAQGLLSRLNQHSIEKLSFYGWNGSQLNGYNMARRPGAVFVRFLVLMLARLSYWIGGNDRKNKKQSTMGLGKS